MIGLPQRIADELVRVEGVAAVVLGGSLASGRAAALKSSAETSPAEAAKRFEALLGGMLVKEMRKSLPEGFFGGGTGFDELLIAGQCEPRKLGVGASGRELRALFTTVLRSSRTAYRREYGYLSTRSENDGVNVATGSLRLAVGLVEMLRRL